VTVTDFIVQITNEAILITILVSAPSVVVSLLIGVIVAIFSATTQIQEQSLSFVPKVVAVFGVLMATGPWVGAVMLRFAVRCLAGFPDVIP